MISRLIVLSIRYRTLVVLIAIVCAVAGAYSAAHTPVDAVPDLSENQVIVFTDWPGHGPQEVEQHVTYPVSRQIQGLEGVRVVRGSSDVGYSMIHVIFDDDVSFADARRRIQDQLATLNLMLPQGVVPRLAADGIPTGQIYWYTVEGTGDDLGQLRSLQDWTIAPQIRSVPGVAEVASVGGFVPELIIQLEPDLLAAYGLTVRQLEEELARPSSSVGGHVVHKGNAEFVVQFTSELNSAEQVANWRQRRVALPDGRSLQLGDVARVAWGPAFRRGMFEKDGNEVVAGIVHLRYGHNTLEVTRQVRERLRAIVSGLPDGVRVVPCYDRTPLIRGAVDTVTRALVEALAVAAVCVLLVLRHFRAWLVIALTLPLCVLGTFLGMNLLRSAGLIDVQTNIMSLAGIVISIGVLIDSSIVMTENVMHRLHLRFGSNPVRGNVDETIAEACQTVGWPVFCSILVMLISFAPVFALSGIDGRMYRPLAWTKSLALVSAAILAITLVPALCSFLVRGQIRDESDSSIVRGVISVYRPMLSWLLDRPQPLILILCTTLLLAAIPLQMEIVLRAILFLSLILIAQRSMTSGHVARGIIQCLFVIVLTLVGQRAMSPIGIEMRLPLDEGMVMDMPITIPRASITQTADDLKARNMMLCRFPEVSMVTGKGGRADTPFDPAPLDMIESMIEFRPRELWPRRRLKDKDASWMTDRLIQELVSSELVEPVTAEEKQELIEIVRFRYDAIQRETAWQLTEVFHHRLSDELTRTLIESIGQELKSDGRLSRPLTAADVSTVLTDLPPAEIRDLIMVPSEESVSALWPKVIQSLTNHEILTRDTRKAESAAIGVFASLSSIRRTIGVGQLTSEERVVAKVRESHKSRWRRHSSDLNQTLHRRAANSWIRLVLDECYLRGKIVDERLIDVYEQIAKSRAAVARPHDESAHHGLPDLSELPLIDPYPKFDSLCRNLANHFSRSILLWPHDPVSLAAFGGEMDRVLQMPGWTNVWTRPIQNRVDMLATGVNAEVGIRVLGRHLDDVVRASEEIAAILKEIPGAADVVADPVRGKGVIQIIPDAERAAAMGVSMTDLQAVLEIALSGKVVDQILDGRQRHAVRLRMLSSAAGDDELTIRRLPIPCRLDATQIDKVEPSDSSFAANLANTSTHKSNDAFHSMQTVPLDSVATVIVTEGPATIKSENGWLRNYVRLNVRDRSPFDFVKDAKRAIAGQVSLPSGIFTEWTGQFEHAESTRRTLLILIPGVMLIILGMLYITYRDWTDALLMLMSAPGALAGGILCQWLLGFPFSIAVGVGYIACFGMAAATGIVMLVYLREAVELAGGLEQLSLEELKNCVLNGAVHRLRPKLLTEATTILGLAPMLWSDGIGAEVIRPMAAPVLGGILIADEVIDLLLPVLFYQVRRHRWLRIHSSSTPTKMNDKEC